MKIWILKAIIQKCISFLPFSHQINFLFQKYITKGVQLSDEYYEDRLTHCQNHFDALRKFNNTPHFTSLEIGTGWYPVGPIGLFLMGSSQSISVDISALMNKKQLWVTLEKFMQYEADGKLQLFLKNILPERWEQLEQTYSNQSLSFEAALSQLNIKSIVGDARKLPLPDGSIDLIHSNNTFEHIYPQILEDILIEFKRLLNTGGVMSHAVDMSDHFAHLDKKINIYNFLKFSEKQWNWIDNTIQPQNRWRLSDYKNLYQKLEIPILYETVRKDDPEGLRSIKINEQYADKDFDDLVVSHCHLVSLI